MRVLRNAVTFHGHSFSASNISNLINRDVRLLHYKSHPPRRLSLRVFLGTIYRRMGRESEFYISINRPFVLNTFGCNGVSGLRGELKIERRGRGTITSERRAKRVGPSSTANPNASVLHMPEARNYFHSSNLSPTLRGRDNAKYSILMTFTVYLCNISWDSGTTQKRYVRNRIHCKYSSLSFSK